MIVSFHSLDFAILALLCFSLFNPGTQIIVMIYCDHDEHELDNYDFYCKKSLQESKENKKIKEIRNGNE
jgi:hypothetical protein